jgi:hypothetical protein
MPVFTALMESTFEGEDPFTGLDRNDRFSPDAEARILPHWVISALEEDSMKLQHTAD